HYTKGSALEGAPEPPAFTEVWEMFNTVHERALQHVATLNNEQLEAPNRTGTRFGGQEQVRDVIMGAIRHEGYHCGQLGWLCKIHGIPTF
ncbi:MAG TPA: DinB family protein, partial [Flavobacteriales bacterium]